MFVENPEMFDVSLVKDKESGLYLMVKDSSTLPERYDVVKRFKDVPKPVVTLLGSARSLEETLEVLANEDRKTKNYINKIFDYENSIVKLLKEPENK
jgi:hypothetical protein